MTQLQDYETGCVLVTGGASGIGAATVERFRADGRTVIIGDRRLEAAERTARDLGAFAFELDISSEPNVIDVVTQIENSHGPIDILVNCAGPLQNTDRPEDLSMKTWDRIVNVHFRGTYLVTVEVGKRMAQRRRGSIVTIASVAGIRSAPLHAYGPAKAALINLNEGLAAEWGPRNVRVNTVSPGFVSTPALARGLDEQVLVSKLMDDSTALGRSIEASEVAAAIHFLGSDAASAITGCNLPVDAGYLVAGSWGAYGGLRSD